MRLRTQFIFLNSLLVLATVAVVAIASFVAQKRRLVEDLDQQRQRQATAFAEVCRQALISKNELVVAGYLKSLSRLDDLAYAYFVDDAGIIHVHTDVQYLHRPLRDWKAQAAPRRVIENSVPVMLGGVKGYAAIGFRADAVENRLKAAIRDMARWIAAAASLGLALGLILALMVSLLMTRPIQKLAQGAYDIGQGRFDTRVDVHSSEEVSRLAAVFNSAAESLGQLDRMKDEFIAGVSHDLRSPLAAIVSYADVLREGLRGPLNDLQKEYIGTMRESAIKLTHFVNDILDVSLLKVAKLRYEMREVEMGPLVRRVVDLFGISARHRNVSFEVFVPEGIRINADEGKLERVWVNLISNAIKFVPNEGGRIQIEVVDDGDSVRCAVIDNGPGVDPKNRERIFQKFVTLNPNAVELNGAMTAAVEKARGLPGNSGGVGLGLTLVKTFVEGHGGRVWVEPAPGGGAAFIFTLPPVRSAAAPEEPRSA